jgi:hypothetical protein
MKIVARVSAPARGSLSPIGQTDIHRQFANDYARAFNNLTFDGKHEDSHWVSKRSANEP